MKSKQKVVYIPNLTFHSDYFKCSRCGWEDPTRRLVKGDIAHVPCQNCGFSYLVRIK